MHQRKTADGSNANDRGRTGATIAYGNKHNNDGSSDNTNNNDVKRGLTNLRRTRRRRTTKTFELSRFLFPAVLLFGVLFCLLWIRMLWKIGSASSTGSKDGDIPATIAMKQRQRAQRRSEEHRAPAGGNAAPAANNNNLFEVQSREAPVCRNVGSPDDIGTTLVTQLSHDRLWMMKHHCERYGPHPVSIAVYSNSTRSEILDELKAMGCSVRDAAAQPPPPLGTTTDEALKKQRDDDENKETDDDKVVAAAAAAPSKGASVSVLVLDAHTHGAWNDYPVNELRNLALKNVRTTHITYIDVDFWPSEGLYERILSPPIRRRLFDDPKLALIIPAFQLKRGSDCKDETRDCREEHVPRMPRTIGELTKMMYDHKVDIFDPTNRGGHGSTNYQHWFQHQLGGEKPTSLLYDIPCLKSHRYEPFVTIRYCKELTPPFQSAFSGYGKNKMTWMMQVVASGFVFSQVGGVYLVHYPHAISKSREDWNRAPKELQQRQQQQIGSYSVRRPKKSDGDLAFDRYKRGKVDDLYLRFKEWLKETIPSDRARLPMCENVQDDDNKLWIDPNRKDWKTK